MRIAVASGKGGTGKTFLATNLFRVMDSAGLDVCLADCDAEVPNDSLFFSLEKQQEWVTRIFCPEIDGDSCIFCGDCAESCAFHAITCVEPLRFIRVNGELCHGCRACCLACTHGAVRPSWEEGGRVTAYGKEGNAVLYEGKMAAGRKSPVAVIRDTLSKASAAGHDYLILDAPPGCSCPFVNTVMSADLVVLVTEPTPFGLGDLKNTVSVLRKMDKAFAVVINRSDLGDGNMKKWLKEVGITVLAEIPYSADLARWYASGGLAVEKEVPAERLFRGLMEKIIRYEGSNSQR